MSRQASDKGRKGVAKVGGVPQKNASWRLGWSVPTATPAALAWRLTQTFYIVYV